MGGALSLDTLSYLLNSLFHAEDMTLSRSQTFPILPPPLSGSQSHERTCPFHFPHMGIHGWLEADSQRQLSLHPLSHPGMCPAQAKCPDAVRSNK